MKDRIKLLRKHLRLNQVEFGERVGVKGNTIGNYEVGLRNPSDAVIFSICREFNVNEEWLRSGHGTMFQEISDDKELALCVAELLDSEDDEFVNMVIDIVKTYRSLDSKSKDILKAYSKKLAENMQKRKEG